MWKTQFYKAHNRVWILVTWRSCRARRMSFPHQRFAQCFMSSFIKRRKRGRTSRSGVVVVASSGPRCWDPLDLFYFIYILQQTRDINSRKLINNRTNICLLSLLHEFPFSDVISTFALSIHPVALQEAAKFYRSETFVTAEISTRMWKWLLRFERLAVALANSSYLFVCCTIAQHGNLN